jgi:S1-C subfamily serine protease
MMLKTLLIVTTLVLSFGCVETQCSRQPDERINQESIVPVESFVKIKKEVVVNDETKVSVGSGSVIKITENETLILTAKHVCQVNIMDFLEDLSLRSFLYVIDIDGLQYPAEIYDRSIKHDICVLKVKENINRPALKLASSKPMIGERVYNIAAPLGIFYRRMVPIFEGFYTGDDDGDSYYTIPTKGGSSGSPILNKDMQLIGITIKYLEELESLAVAISYEDLKDFLKDK